MYAMDQTMHLEHRTEQRRPRWELRRLGARTTSSDPTRQPQAVTADAEKTAIGFEEKRGFVSRLFVEVSALFPDQSFVEGKSISKHEFSSSDKDDNERMQVN